MELAYFDEAHRLKNPSTLIGLTLSYCALICYGASRVTSIDWKGRAWVCLGGFAFVTLNIAVENIQ